jgi:hypothetical protein
MLKFSIVCGAMAFVLGAAMIYIQQQTIVTPTKSDRESRNYAIVEETTNCLENDCMTSVQENEKPDDASLEAVVPGQGVPAEDLSRSEPEITTFTVKNFDGVSGGPGTFVWHAVGAKACALYRMVSVADANADTVTYEPIAFPLPPTGEHTLPLDTGDYALWCGDLLMIPGNDRPGWGAGGWLEKVVQVLPKKM